MHRTTIALALTLCAASLGAQPTPSRAEVLVLGVYHMANPGRDVFNMQADDVLALKRQGEIAQVIEALKKFHPTKVAIEADVYSERVLVIFGAGHLGWLQHDFAGNPNVRLRKLAELAK